MKKVIALMLVMPLLGLIGCAKGFDLQKTAGELTVAMHLDKNPFVGANDMTITVKDKAGSPVTDAAIAVEYSMPAMPGMPAMNYKADATPQGTQYKATMNLSMPGAWSVALTITRAGKMETVNFNVDAQ
jgi:hypothetical protein